MKEFLKLLTQKWLSLIISLFVGYLFAFATIDIINKNVSYYQATYEVSDITKYDYTKLTDEEYLLSIKESGKGKYDSTDVSKMLKNNDFSYTINGNTITITTKYKYYDEFFLSSSNSVSTRAKTFVKNSALGLADKTNEITFEDSTNIVTLYKYINKWAYSFFGLLIAFITYISAFAFLYFKKIDFLNSTEYEYDNQTMFKTIFHKEYWKLAAKPLVKVKQITLLAMLFALMMASKFIPLPSGFGNLGISFTYLFFAIIGMIYGPIYCFVIGIFSDTIGYFINSGGGAFNFGYTLQAALTGFIYGCCFFKTRVSFSRALLARTLVNFLMNVLLGSFLFIFVMYFNNSSDFTMKAYLEKVKYYMLLLSLPKNVVYLLPQSVLLYYVIKVISPILVKFKVLDKQAIEKLATNKQK